MGDEFWKERLRDESRGRKRWSVCELANAYQNNTVDAAAGAALAEVEKLIPKTEWGP